MTFPVLLPAPIRVGLHVAQGDGELLGVIVVDGRPGLDAAACRRCWWVVYDVTTEYLAAGALVRHLQAAHGAHDLGVAVGPLRRERRLGQRRFAIAAAIERAVTMSEGVAA